MAAITVLVAILAVLIYFMNTRVQEDTSEVSASDIPTALLSISMLDEIGDMNANVLEYVLGEAEEKLEFEDNHREFSQFLKQLKQSSPLHRERIGEIEALFDEYTTSARQGVFNSYNPEAEAWAKQRVEALTRHTGDSLEILLDDLKESEISDAGTSQDMQEIISDDLPGVRLYLELVDEAGDMVNDLNSYQQGDVSAKEHFIRDSQAFEQYLQQLKPLEQKPQEIEDLKQVDALYRVMRDGGFEVFERYDPRSKNTAIKAIDDLEHRIFSRLETRLDELAFDSNTIANDSLSNLRDLTANNQFIMLMLAAAVTLACMIIAFYAYRVVSRPMSELSNQVKALAEGHTNIEISHQNRGDEIGNMAQAMEVFKRNIIARDQAEVDLLSAKESAEAASLAKANFLATMSHEIRTPMNGVIGMIDLLLTSHISKDQLSMVNTIRDSAFSLLNIINDILDFSKIEAGKIDLEEIDFSPLNLIEGVADTLSPNASRDNVSLNLFTDPKLPATINGDPVRVRQVLFNLIGNAIKFSSKTERRGEVSVIVTRVPAEAPASANINIEIIDNGVGIPSDQLQHLFEPFSQAESSTTRRFGGTGLGLAISKNLIDILGGNISVTSELNKGSNFSLSLPFNVSDGSLIEEFSPDNSRVVLNTLKSPHISFIGQYLDAFHIENRHTLAENVVEELQRQPSDQGVIIITDQIKMVQNALAISAYQHQGPIGFMVLDQNNNKSEYLDATNHYPFNIPLKISALVHAINLITGRESTDAEQAFNDLKRSDQNLSISDAMQKGRLILVAEDNITNQEVIRRQLEKLGYACLIASDGLEAEQLYLKQPVDLVLTDCHMPNRDGYELTRALKAHQKDQQRSVPIIAITANALLGENDKCFAVGMDDYLAKPVELIKLKKMLQKWVPSASQPTVPAELNASSTSTSYEINDLDRSVISSIFIDDENDYQAALKLFVSDCFPQLQQLIESSNSELDIKAVADICHRIKSSARMIGAQQLANACQQLELATKNSNKKTIIDSINGLQSLIQTTEDLIATELQNGHSTH